MNYLSDSISDRIPDISGRLLLDGQLTNEKYAVITATSEPICQLRDRIKPEYAPMFTAALLCEPSTSLASTSTNEVPKSPKLASYFFRSPLKHTFQDPGVGKPIE
jgi:hypothetical protein